MAGIALLIGNFGDVRSRTLMFGVAHDALRLLLIGAFFEGFVMRRRRRALEIVARLAGLRQRIWRPRGANPCGRIAIMRRMAGRTAFFTGKLRMPTGKLAWTERTDRARAVAVKGESADQRHDQHRRQYRKAGPVTAQRQGRFAGRVLITALSIGQRPIFAGAAALRRPAACPAAFIEMGCAFACAAATTGIVGTLPARLAPKTDAPAPIAEIGPFIWAFVLAKSVLIGDHSAYTFTRMRCQTATSITAIDNGT